MSDTTPTEELILEVLAGRTRLGHNLWTFAGNSASTRAAKSLKDKGLIHYLNGVTPNTFRACLTDQGKARQMDDPNYIPPILGGPK